MKLIIAGDFCPFKRTVELFQKGCFEDVLGDIKPILHSADYSLVNLECPVINENSVVTPIPKCGPNLRTDMSAVEAIKYAGFKGVTLANNHILDYGERGLTDTIAACRNKGLDVVGVGKNILDAKRVLYKNVAQKCVAFINCCEHEFSIATEESSGANPMDPISQYYAIREAKEQADFVILIVHGGHEHYQLPSPRMKEWYRYFVDCGVDAVINHHQHCYSGYEIYKGKPIFYGIGNFCFDNENYRSGFWTQGFLVELDIKDSDIKFHLWPYIQCAEKPTVKLMDSRLEELFMAHIKELNVAIANEIQLKREYEKWAVASSWGYKLALSPYSNRFLRAAAVRGLIPMLLSKEKVLTMLNYVNCEAHRERLIYVLNKAIEKCSH